jgi:eukaryotic-like serine/threonine-protein kinase
MSPRRRLRTRYEPGAGPAVAPAAPGGASSPAPGAEDALLAGPPSDALAPLVASPAAPAPASEPASPPSDALASPVASPPARAPAAEIPGRPAPEVIEEWAKAFEVPAAVEAERAESRRALARRLRSGVTLTALAVLAFATGLLVFNNLVMPRLIHGVGQVTVPDLTNLTVEQAEQALRPLGLQVSRAGERFDPAAPRGFVIDQEPGAGSTVRGRKRIAVVVSLGEEFSSVPELFGESVRSARGLIQRAGLRSGSIVQAPSEEVGEGMVAASDPGAEAVLMRNTAVHLLVSTGAGSESYVMPDLLGREIAGVRRQLEALGFRIERSGAQTSVGTIVAQRPPPGSRITRADVIQLTASGRIIR